jgi:ribosome-associated protein
MEDLVVSRQLVVPADEMNLRYSRSGGPGGQHVNTTSTRVEIVWNVVHSRALSEAQRELLLARLARRIDGDGDLRLVVDTTRSQHENRRLAFERLGTLVAAALRPRRVRRPTAPSAAARMRRLEAKRRRSEAKRRRQVPEGDC